MKTKLGKVLKYYRHLKEDLKQLEKQKENEILYESKTQWKDDQYVQIILIEMVKKYIKDNIKE